MSVPNLDKLFQYFKCVAKEPIEFSGYCSASRNWGFIGYVSLDKITEIQINSGFFLTDTCQMCGGCCPAESNVYTKSEFEAIQNCKDEDFLDAGLKPAYLHKLRSGLIEEKYVINGSVVSVYVYKLEPNRLYLPTREKIISRCTWCYQESDTIFKCRIHPVESITCIMPHLRIFHFSGHGKSSIGLAQFGRNWALKCPIDLIEPQTEEQFENNVYISVTLLVSHR